MTAMRDDLKALELFLTSNGVNEAEAQAAMARAKELLNRTRARGLECGAAPEQDEAVKAVSSAVGRDVRRVVFLSAAKFGLVANAGCSDDLPGPSGWNLFEDFLDASLGEKLADVLWSGNQAEIFASLPFNLIDRLFSGLSTRSDLRGRLLGTRNQAIQVCVFFRLAFTLAHKPGEAARFDPLMRLLGHCLVFGEKRDEPGVWIGLKA